MTATAWDSLPAWVRSTVRDLGLPDAEAWVARPLPALDGRSVAQAANDPDAEPLLRRVLGQMRGGFPSGT